MATKRVDAALPEAFQELWLPSRYKAFYGGRGSGKSHSFATALLLQAMSSPLRVLCAREVQKSIRESVKQLLDDKIAEMGLDAFWTSTRDELNSTNGSQFRFSGLQDHTAETIKSFEGADRAWVEEAQTLSSRSLEMLIPTIRKPGSELWFSWNPRNASDPVDKRFRGLEPPPNSIIRRVNYDANPFFPNELEDEREYDRRTNPDRYGHIWLGEYEPVAIGAIWNRLVLHEGRREAAPPLTRVLVGIDPAISSEAGSDMHGIVVTGLGEDGRGYVLEDGSLKGSPTQWAQRAVAMFDKWDADAVVVERNQGGDMCKHTLRTVRGTLPVVEVHATRGKHVRAEPIASLYHLGRVSHVGTFSELEDQMCQMTAAGYEGEGSPDRCDALVWTLTELFPRMAVKAPKKPATRYRLPAGAGSWMG